VSKKKTSLSAMQGQALPPDGSPISAYPNGCCVLVDHGGEVAWHMLLFRIGRTGPPFCGRMSNLPTSVTWNHGMGDSRSIPEPTIVLASAWPLRARAAEVGIEEDPLQTGELVEGSLMIDHLFSVRHSIEDGRELTQSEEEGIHR
jgi:hypothetical protein